MVEELRENNVIRLIRLIKERDVLWDVRRTRGTIDERNEAWDQVLTMIDPEYANSTRDDQEKEKGDLKKKWTKMRDQFKKCWLEAKTFYYNGCKIENDKLNFLIPVFEKRTSKKQQPSHSRLDMILNMPGPSKAPQEPPDIGEDDDTETVLNYNLREFGSSNIFEHELSRDSNDNNYQVETVTEQHSSTNHRNSLFVANNKGIITVLKASKTSDIAGGLSDHEEEVSEKVRQLPPPHTIAPEPPEIQSSSGSHFQDEYLVKTTPDQSNAKGTKRLKLYDTEINCQKEQGTKRPHLDDTEIKKQGFLNYIEGSTEKFNHTQNTNFCIEISSLLKLYLDKGTTLSNDELSDFNSRALRVLLSTLTNCYDQVIDILQTILNTGNLFELLGHSNCCKEISSLLPSYLGRGTTLSNQDLSDFNSRVLRVLLSTVTNLDSDKLDIIIMNIVKESMKEGKNV